MATVYPIILEGREQRKLNPATDTLGAGSSTATGTTNADFTVDSDATTGKIKIAAAAGAADKTLTITNTALTDDRTLTLPNSTGIVALTSDIPAMFQQSTNDARVVQDGITDTFTAGVGAISAVNIPGTYSGTDITFKTSVSSIGSFPATGNTLKIVRTAGTGSDSGKYILCENGSASQKFVVNALGNVLIGTAAAGTNATNSIVISNGTPPASSPADAVQLYAGDQSAGNAAFIVRAEGGQTVSIGKSIILPQTTARALLTTDSATDYTKFGLATGGANNIPDRLFFNSYAGLQINGLPDSVNFASVSEHNNSPIINFYGGTGYSSKKNTIVISGPRGYETQPTGPLEITGGYPHASSSYTADPGQGLLIRGGNHGTTGTVEGSVVIANANGTTKMAEFNESKISLMGMSKAGTQGVVAQSLYRFAADGDAQKATYTLAIATANATPAEMFLNGVDLRRVIPLSSTWGFTVQVSCYNTTDNLGAVYYFKGGIRRNAAGVTALIGSLVKEEWEEAGMEACDVNITADDTNDSLLVTVTGIADKSMRWNATVITSEVSFGTP